MKKLFLLYSIFNTIFLVAQEPRLMLPIGNAGAVNSAVFSPDGKRILTSGADATAKIWDARTGILLVDLKGHQKGVNYAKYSPDGKKIVTGGDDGKLIIWNALTGIKQLEIAGCIGPVSAMEFSPDGKNIATLGKDNYFGFVRVWDLSNGTLISYINDTTGTCFSIQFSANGENILTAGKDDKTKIWDVSTGMLIMEYGAGESEQSRKSLLSSRYNKNSDRIVSSFSDGSTGIYDSKTGKLIRNFKGPLCNSSFTQFSPNGENIVTISCDLIGATLEGYIQILQVATGKTLIYNNYSGTDDHQHSFEQLKFGSFNLDGSRIVIINVNRLKIYNINKGNIEMDIACNSGKINTANFDTEGKRIVTASDSGLSKIYNSYTGELLNTLEGHCRKIIAQGKNPMDSRILFIMDDASVGICDSLLRWLFTLNGHKARIRSVEFSPDGKTILTASDDSTMKVWSAFTGALIRTIKDDFGSIISANFTPDGRNIITLSSSFLNRRSIVKIWDAETGNLRYELPDDIQYLSERLSVDGKRLLTWNINGNVNIWDVSSGQKRVSLSGGFGIVISARFSPDGQKIITASGTKLTFWNSLTGIKLFEIEESEAMVSDAIFSPDGSRLFLLSGNLISSILDAENGHLLTNLQKQNAKFLSAEFSPDSKKILTVSDDGFAEVTDASNGNLVFKLAGNTDQVISSHFSSDGKRIFTISEDGSFKVWNAGNGKLICTLISFGGQDHMNLIPGGKYRCTPLAAKQLHYITADLKVITFNQLDVKNNRPDKVLEATGCPDTALINCYRQAYYKRIKKLGIDTGAFNEGYNVPDADIVNRNSIEKEQKSNKLLVHIMGMDSICKLDRYNVWVNEVPVFGLRGVSIRGKKGNTLDEKIFITLSEGENRIEVSVTNINGAESYRMPLIVNYTPPKLQKVKVYFIGIGIDSFADERYNLNYSAKDIRDLGTKLKEKYGENISIDTLFNKNVTLNNVKALKQKLLKTNVNDKVIVSYSGHGLLSKDYDYYLSTYRVNFSKPEQNGLPYDELEHLLDSIPARKKLILIDACHSGEVDKEEVFAMNRKADSLGLTKPKGSELLIENNEQRIGLKNSFELMQSLFVNVGKNTGTVIISAAAGNEFALESGKWNNGVFTWCILEALQNYPAMKVSELKKIVGERVEQLTNGMQKPTYRNETIAVDWNIW